jgi:hypothetical protein
MTDPRVLENEKRLYIAIKERLRAEDPEIDERTLADTVEGLTDLPEILAEIVRAACKDEDEAELVLKKKIADMTERRARFNDRAERRRNMVRDAMDRVGMKSLVMADFTASIRKGAPHVVVVDEALIPQTFWEQRPHLRKRELLDALKDGEQIEGATLSNPGMTLSVRTR